VRYKVSEDGEEMQLKVQSPEIDAEAYGIPREGPYYPDAKSRSFYKFPFCHDRRRYDVDYDSIEQFYNKLIEIDEFCNTDEFRKQVFGEKMASQYAYQPLVRVPEVEEDDEETEPKVDKNGEPYYRPPYTKIRLDLEYSPDQENPSTKPAFAVFERKDGKRNKVELNNFDDLLVYMKYRSKLRFIISFSKIYAMKTKSGSEKKKYGITLKASHVEVQRPAGSLKVAYDEDAFIDSDTDEVITSNVVTVTRNVPSLDVDLDSGDDDTVETNQVSAVLNSAKQTSKQVVVDDEEDEVVEEVNVKAKTKKAPQKLKSKTAGR